MNERQCGVNEDEMYGLDWLAGGLFDPWISMGWYLRHVIWRLLWPVKWLEHLGLSSLNRCEMHAFFAGSEAFERSERESSLTLACLQVVQLPLGLFDENTP